MDTEKTVQPTCIEIYTDLKILWIHNLNLEHEMIHRINIVLTEQMFIMVIFIEGPYHRLFMLIKS